MNSNNNKTFLMCGVLLAIITAFGFWTAIQKMENLVPIVVATRNIEPHTEITDKMVRIEEIPSISRSEVAIDDTALVIGGYSTTKIFEGQTLIQPMVAKQFDETGASGIALSIPDENLRAVSFPASAQTCFGGKVKKGDYVDLIASFDGGALGTNTGITKTILQGVAVFDVVGEGDALSAITLLVTLQQAEIIYHAYTIGTVSFALNPGNAKAVPTSGIVNESICKRYNFICTQPGK